jgi:Aspartyl protease
MTSRGGKGVRRPLLAALAVVLLGTANCRSRIGSGEPAPGDNVVDMVVLTGPGGETMALVPVYINGDGPFAFALDTGASHSMVDRSVAEQLNLPVVGPAVRITGVTSTARAEEVRVDRWRVGNVELPRRTLVTLELPQSDRETGLKGLLGSDMLSEFGVIMVDYQRQRLIFRPK